MSHTMNPPLDELVDPLAESAEISTASPDAAGSRSSSFFARHGLSNRDVLLTFVAVLLACVYLPVFSTWFWTPRMMIAVGASLPGLVALIDLARRRDRAAQFALATLAWASLSALMSGEALLAFKGHLLQEASVLAYAGALGLWGLAREMTPAGRRILLRFVLGALAVNLLIATFQVVAQWTAGDLGLAGARATGLTPNSGHFGAFCVAGISISVWSAARSATLRSSTLWTAGAFVFGTGLAYSGSRIGLGAVALVAAWVVLTKRNWWSLAASAGSVAGVLVGTVVGRSFGLRDSLSRTGALTNGGDRLGGRIDMWNAGLQAVQERPLLGWGAGRFRTATQGRWSFDFVARGGDSQQIPDAHNVVIAMAVALGIPGLMLLAMFVWHAMRRARGPLALATAGIAVTWMFQPAGLVTLPLAMLMLGAAMGPSAPAELATADVDGGDAAAEPLETTDAEAGGRRSSRRFMGAALACSLLGAGWLGIADVRFASAAATLDPEALDAVAPMFIDDPIVGRSVARAWQLRASFEADAVPEFIARHQSMVDAEPKRPYWWTQLASAQGQAGLIDEAVASARQAIELQPTSLDAWRILLVASGDLDDPAMADEAMTNLCRLGADECDR